MRIQFSSIKPSIYAIIKISTTQIIKIKIQKSSLSVILSYFRNVWVIFVIIFWNKYVFLKNGYFL